MSILEGNEDVTVVNNLDNDDAPAIDVNAEPAEGGDTSGDGAVVPPAGDPAAPAPYTPDFKLKVMDQEYEIPEIFRGLMTDEEKAKQVREFAQKAYGLDWHKPRSEKLKQDFTQTQAGLDALHNFVTTYHNKKDVHALDQFLSFWGLDKDKLAPYMAEKFRYDDMSPEQKAQYDGQRRQQYEAQTYAQQNQVLKQQMTQVQADMRMAQLDSALSTPTMVESIKAYDARVGYPGAFKDAVIRQGQLAHFTSGGKKDLTVQEAIAEAAVFLKLVEPQSAGAPASAPNIVAPAAQKKLPVIPNLGSGGSSPVKKQISSVDDLRARRKALQDNQ